MREIVVMCSYSVREPDTGSQSGRKMHFLIFFAKKFGKPKMFIVPLHRFSKDSDEMLSEMLLK